MAFSPLGNSDHVVVSVSIDFPLNSKWDAPFHCIAYGCSSDDWDGLILKVSASSAASEFFEWFRLELMSISLIVSIRLSLTDPHSFQQLVLLP